MGDALQGWHNYLQSKDARLLHAILHPDVVFESPVVFTPQQGRAITLRYLGAAARVLGGPGFRYTGEWRGARGAVLEFETVVEGKTINGVDMIDLSEDGSQITHFKVMVRPLQAMQLLHRLMGEALQAGGA